MYCIIYDVLSQISYLANALTIIRKRIFKLQISNFLAARARLFASESSYLALLERLVASKSSYL